LAAARQFQIDFIPLFEERFDLVIPEEYYQSALLLPALEYIQSSEFRSEMMSLGGYNSQDTGNEISV
jgi:putative molybdopterin biosynthesis protein